MKRVYVVQDNDCDWYILPYELKKSFLDDCEKEDYEEFDNKYGEYRTGGDINLVELYIK